VQDVAVVARNDESGDKALIAYVSTSQEPGPPAEELLRHVKERLPAHMTPSRIVRLAALPLTQNGKVDRNALPAPTRAEQTLPVGPQSPVQATLVHIWEDVLRVHPVDITQDFFELGGHSLLAVRMFTRLHQELGVRLPLAALFQAPTVAGLAALIADSERAAGGWSLMPIRATGGRPPLFAMPGMGGNVLCYGTLAKRLGPDQPFYGLQSCGLDGLNPPLTRMEDIAAHFLRPVRAVQPEGPYFLLGTCVGGIVAWEMAQQLRAAGQRVAFLGLVDTWPPAFAPPVQRITAFPRLQFALRRVGSWAQTARQRRGRERLAYLRERIDLVARCVARQDVSGDARAEFYRRLVSDANVQAWRDYRLPAYDGPVVLFRAARRRIVDGDGARLLWRGLAPNGLEIHSVPANDSGLMLVEPAVSELADLLEQCLARTRAPAASGGAA